MLVCTVTQQSVLFLSTIFSSYANLLPEAKKIPDRPGPARDQMDHQVYIDSRSTSMEVWRIGFHSTFRTSAEREMGM